MHRFRNIDQAAAGKNKMCAYIITVYIICILYLINAGGHLEVIRWLTENAQAPCTSDAMDNAAGNGHLAVVKWLHENRYYNSSLRIHITLMK